MDTKDNLLGVVQTLFKWKRQILFTCLIAAMGSIGISLFLPDYFEAVTTFYATSADQAKPAPVGPPLKERAYYGIDEDIDRILAIAESGELINYIIQEFNLYEHYDINPDNEKAAHRIRQKFLKYYNVKKTKFESIELSVEDKDKQKATDMANAARVKIDEIAQRLIKENQAIQMETYKSNIAKNVADAKLMGDSLFRVRQRFGIYDSSTQGESLSSQLFGAKARLANNKARLGIMEESRGARRDSVFAIKARIKGLEKEIESLQSAVDKFAEGLAQVKALEDILEEAGEQSGMDRETFKQIEVAHENGFSAIMTLEEATVPIVKSRPKRSIIVISSVLIAFIFSVIGVLLIDTYRDVNWNEILNGEA